MAIFPSYVLPERGSYKEQYVDVFADDDNDMGPSVRRAMSTRLRRKISFTSILTNDELEGLREFYRDEISNGVDIFEWDHPDGTPMDMRFVSAFEISDIGHDAWKVQIQLEEVF